MPSISSPQKWLDPRHEIVLFSSTAIALYGYDQGMMSLINTNKSYLKTMQISEESPVVGVIVSVCKYIPKFHNTYQVRLSLFLLIGAR